MKKNKSNQRIHILAGLIICLSLILTPALAEDASPGIPPTRVEKYDPSATAEIDRETPKPDTTTIAVYIPFIRRDRSGLAVNPQNRQASLDFFKNQYVQSGSVAINWTGNHGSCNPGTTSQEFRDAVLRRINYFRAMAGVPADITFSEESNRLAQAAALMMSVNRQLNHSPPASWTCYSSDGAAGAGSSNLYLGVYRWDAITGYMQDPGSGNYPAGHRRWILYPQTQIMGTGDIPPVSNYSSANALRVFDDHMWEQRPATREEFVAWPPSGYVPYQVVFPRWSFAYAQADFSTTSVTIMLNGKNVPLAQAALVNGYGENTLVWIPNGMSDGATWPVPAQDMRYTVTIHNALINSENRDFSYEVIIFNPGT